MHLIYRDGKVDRKLHRLKMNWTTNSDKSAIGWNADQKALMKF
jgi:hypothetical protein